MGYRSQVRSCVYSDNAELFDAFIAGQKLINNIIWEGFGESLEFTDKKYTYRPSADENMVEQVYKILDLYGDDWKWYDSYPDVQAWDKFIHDAVDAGLNYEFCRVGEEDGDIEYESGGEEVQYFLSTSTTINVDY
jgi:hypothetical protein